MSGSYIRNCDFNSLRINIPFQSVPITAREYKRISVYFSCYYKSDTFTCDTLALSSISTDFVVALREQITPNQIWLTLEIKISYGTCIVDDAFHLTLHLGKILQPTIFNAFVVYTSDCSPTDHKASAHFSGNELQHLNG